MVLTYFPKLAASNVTTQLFLSTEPIFEIKYFHKIQSTENYLNSTLCDKKVIQYAMLLIFINVDIYSY